MKLTKLGHCCLLLEEKNLRILTDPGVFSQTQNALTDIDIILISHEHADHFDIESVKKIMLKNPQAQIYTTKGVDRQLSMYGFKSNVLGNGERIFEKGVLIEAVYSEHALIYPNLASVDNFGFYFEGRLFVPGDAFIKPDRPVEILALPVAAPWLKLSESIDYALEIKPRLCFPVHDDILKTPGSAHRLPQNILTPAGIKFTVFENNQQYNL